MTPRAILLALALTSVAAQAADSQGDAALARMAKIDKFASEAPSFLPRDSMTKLRALDTIAAETSESAANPYGHQPTVYRRLRFTHGLEVTFRVSGDKAPPQYTSVAISSARWPLRGDVGVGADRHRVIDLLGAPDTTQGPRLTYVGETEKVVFEITSGRVAKVEFDYYVD